MTIKYLAVTTLLVCVAAPAMASQPVGSPLAVDLGGALGTAVGSVLPTAVGGALPVGIGGVAAIAALTLIAGIQLVKRKKK